MPQGVSVITGPWRDHLRSVVQSARQRLLVCAPFVSNVGARLICDSCATAAAIGRSSLILTDLSPRAVCDGVTDPSAVELLGGTLCGAKVVHLPRLHAKVYCADGRRAIVSSGNLTAGGLELNYECGVLINDSRMAACVERDIRAYASLGATIDGTALANYTRLAQEVRSARRQEMDSATRNARRRLANALRRADDALVRAHLAGGAIHTVFAHDCVPSATTRPADNGPNESHDSTNPCRLV
jgi:phosphatidylserine/phosphatidylglycerophosphate/cardiolipin synthase-like enzyme